MIYTYADGNAEDSYNYFTEYFDYGVFAAGAASDYFELPFRPFDAVVNLTNAELMDKAVLISSSQADFVEPDEIKQYVIEANQ